MSSVAFVHAKKRTRGELRLPQLHFVAVDDWVVKLGNHAFIAWLKFYSWADRSDPEREFDNIPNSLNALVKRLGISKSTFYEKVIRPLWNYGFIDFQQYEKDKTIHINIIVYEYPQNDPKKATSPIEKIRDYDTDYQSQAREYGRIGGTTKAQNRMLNMQNEQDGVVRKSNQGGGTKIEPGVVQNSNQGGTIFEPNNDPNRSNVIENSNDMKIDQSDSISGIESVIQDFIETNDRLTDRRESIMSIYHLVKKELQYSDMLFLYTLKKVMDANVKGSFENYFMRALLNNMSSFTNKEKASTVRNRKSRQVHPLPRSVVEQLAREEVSTTIDVEADIEVIDAEVNNMTPDELVQRQLRALEMLLQLGEISQESYEKERAKLIKAFLA